MEQEDQLIEGEWESTLHHKMIFRLLFQSTGMQPFQSVAVLCLSVVWMVGALHVLSKIFMLKAGDPNDLIQWENTVQGAFERRLRVPTNSSLDPTNSTQPTSNSTALVRTICQDPLVLFGYVVNGTGADIYTIPSDFLNFSMTMLFLGWLCGANFWSMLADRYGRKPACLACFVCLILSDMAEINMPTYELYLLSKSFIGFCIGGIGVISYVWGSEYIALDMYAATHRLAELAHRADPSMVLQVPAYRPQGPPDSSGGALFQIFWSFGGMLLPAVAYLIPYWRHYDMFLMFVL